MITKKISLKDIGKEVANILQSKNIPYSEIKVSTADKFDGITKKYIVSIYYKNIPFSKSLEIEKELSKIIEERLGKDILVAYIPED